MCGGAVARRRGIDTDVARRATQSIGKGEPQPDVAGRVGDGRLLMASPMLSARSDHDTESELWEGGFSPRAMVGSYATIALATFALLVGSGVAFYRDAGALGLFLLLAPPVVWMAQFVRTAKRCWGLRYRLTDRRLFLQAGLLTRWRDQLDLARVEDVRTHQTVVHRFFDIGSIEIRSRDRHLRRVVMAGIPSADEVAELIRAAARRLQPAQPATQAAKAS
jgi:uncharacterized membrane protein YdbT with pleckstrin-like domain